MNRPVSPAEAIALGALGGFVTAVALAMVTALILGTKPKSRRTSHPVVGRRLRVAS